MMKLALQVIIKMRSYNEAVKQASDSMTASM